LRFGSTFKPSSPGRAARGCGLALALWGAVILAALGPASPAGAQAGIQSKLAAGEIIVTNQTKPGSPILRAQMTAIIKAPPEVVWQIITDLNHFQDFMPNTLASMVVPAAKIQGILLQTPITAKQVEELIGPTPAPLPRVPGGKYVVYHYSDLDLPWPCADRWYIVKEVMDETRAAQHYYQSSWSLVIGNVKKNSGGWIVEPYGVNQTRVIYRVATDPGGEIPGFLVRHGTCVTLPDIIKAIRERTAQIGRGKSAS
jgi:hypothetical protein